MADPLVIQAVLRYRAQLESADAATTLDLTRRWLAVQERLGAQIDALVAEVTALRAAGETISRGRLMRLARYQALRAQIDVELAGYGRYASAQTSAAQASAAGLGLSAAGETISAAYQQAGRIAADWALLPYRAVETMAGLAADGTPLTVLIAQSYPLTVRAVTDALVSGIALGWNPRRTAAAARQAADLPLNRALRIARTETMRAYREATRLQYAESGVVVAYKRLAAKSLRTCPACLFADGRIYGLDEPLDEHVNGRCQLIPIIDGVPQTNWQTGRTWFNGLPSGQQSEILGPGAYEKWRRERFDLNRFVTLKENETWGNSLQVTPLSAL